MVEGSFRWRKEPSSLPCNPFLFWEPPVAQGSARASKVQGGRGASGGVSLWRIAAMRGTNCSLLHA